MKRRVHVLSRVLVVISCVFLVLTIGMFAASLCLNDDRYIASNLPPLPVDEEPPIANLVDGNSLTIAYGEPFSDPGIEAYDVRGEVSVDTEGEVDSNKEGDYTIKYYVVDESGNETVVERNVKVIKPSGKVYLTFDDGPGPYTATLLDVLAKYNVKVTFFVTGRGDDEIIAREFKEGHSVALHTQTHDYSYVYSSVENYFNDLYTIQNRVKNITGVAPTLIRFPGGSSNTVSTRYDGGSHIMSTLVNEVTAKGFTYFDWNLSSGDAAGATSADEVYWRVIEGLQYDGDTIVLQHDIKDYSVDAVERIIQYGLEHGFIFDKLSANSFTAHHGVNN